MRKYCIQLVVQWCPPLLISVHRCVEWQSLMPNLCVPLSPPVSWQSGNLTTNNFGYITHNKQITDLKIDIKNIRESTNNWNTVSYHLKYMYHKTFFQTDYSNCILSLAEFLYHCTFLHYWLFKSLLSELLN